MCRLASHLQHGRRVTTTHACSAVISLLASNLASAAQATLPTLDVPLPGLFRLWDTAFSPDGTTLYVQGFHSRFNAWPLAASFWPEALGIAVAGAVFFLVRRCARRWRAKQQVGAWYCRGCNYCLTGLSSHIDSDVESRENRCPECGWDLARRQPAPGRTTVRRLTPGLATLTLVGVGYACVWVSAPRRFGDFSTWVALDWPWLERCLSSWPWVVARCQVQGTTILAVDATTGSIVRTIYSRDVVAAWDFELSPDGATLYLPVHVAGHNRYVEQIDVKTGHRHATLRIPGFASVSASISGLSRDASEVYVSYPDDARMKSVVLAWNPSDGETRTLFEEDASVIANWSRAGTPSTQANRNVVRPLAGPGEQRFLSVDFARMQQTRQFAVRVHEAGRVREFVVPLTPNAPTWDFPIVSPDGKMLFVTQGSQAVAVEIAVGRTLYEFPLRGMVNAAWTQGLLLDPSGRWLLARIGDEIVVSDLDHWDWHRELKLAAGLGANFMCFTPDGKGLAVTAFPNVGTPSPTAPNHVLFYDMRGVLASPD